MESNESIEYIGNELDLFKNAVNWKSYYSSKILDSISGDVLEVGAGIGINSRFLAQKTDRITSYTCVEPDVNLASQIEENIRTICVAKKTVINGTIRATADHTYDTIIYIDVLEHIKESQNEIKLIKQRLRPNGRLIILVPAYNFLFNNFDKNIGHYRRYNKTNLLQDIDSELSIVKLFYLDSLGFFASLMNKIFLKKALPTPTDIHFWDNYIIPVSKFLDVCLFNSFGKSLVGIFQNDK